MPPKCSICEHPERTDIEKALLDGVPLRDIERQYGTGRNALSRHKKNHLPSKLAEAKKAKEVAKADSVLEYVVKLRDKAHSILETAEEAQNYTLMLSAIRECKGVLKLMAEVSGELKREGNTQNITMIQVNVTESQQSRMQELVSRVIDVDADD